MDVWGHEVVHTKVIRSYLGQGERTILELNHSEMFELILEDDLIYDAIVSYLLCCLVCIAR